MPSALGITDLQANLTELHIIMLKYDNTVLEPNTTNKILQQGAFQFITDITVYRMQRVAFRGRIRTQRADPFIQGLW